MNKIIRLVFLFLLLPLCMSAQNDFNVSSFNLDPHDTTPILEGTMVCDQNGEVCALLRIQTTQTGFSFDVGVLGVTKTEQKVGEIWVYVPKGVKRLTLRHQQLGTCEYQFPAGVESGKAYKMKLVHGEVQTIVKKAVTSQYVLFKVTPANAVVELDGQMIETIEGTATKRMPFGTYGYRVQAPKYAPEVGNITVNDPKKTHVVNVNLVPQFAVVTFNADAGVEIWVDNQRRGVGPCSIELGYGTIFVECKKAGHHPTQQEIVITKENASQPITLKNPSPIYGSLDINSAPADAEVWIDGKKLGNTPLFVSEYLIGSHEVKLKKQGYKDLTLTATVQEGQTATVQQTLEKDFSSEGRTFTVNGVTFEMIPVEGGTFRMGATTSTDSDAGSDESPIHSVILSNYSIGKYEVTQALWQAVMGSNPSNFKGDNLPVEQVSWHDCQTFISKLNQLTGQHFRLPTEAEWEYAARGGNRSQGYKYSGSNTIGDVAWYNSNSNSKTHAVGTKKPNELGIYDMSGNVGEWCSDWYKGKYDTNAQTNPQGPSAGQDRVGRGGIWCGIAWGCRSTCRYCLPLGSREYDLGLRLALSQ